MKMRIILLLLAVISFAAPQPLCGQVQRYNAVSRSNPDACKYVVVYRSSGKVLGRFISRYEAERYVKERLENDASMKAGNAKAEIEKQVAECFGLNSTKGINAGITSERLKCTSIPYVIIEPRREGVVGIACDAAETSVDLLNKAGGVVSDGIGAVAEYFQSAEEYDSPSQTDDGLLELLNESPVQARVNDNSNLYAAANSNSDPTVKPEEYVDVMRPSERISSNPALAVSKNDVASRDDEWQDRTVYVDNLGNFEYISRLIDGKKYGKEAPVQAKATMVYSWYMRALEQEEQKKEATANISKDLNDVADRGRLHVQEVKNAVTIGDSDATNAGIRRIWEDAETKSGHFWSDAVKGIAHREIVLDKLVEVCTNPQSKEVDTQMLRRVVDYVDEDVKNTTGDKSSSPVVMPQDKDWKAAQSVLSVLRNECDNGFCK